MCKCVSVCKGERGREAVDERERARVGVCVCVWNIDRSRVMQLIARIVRRRKYARTEK
jgi:hypothetical protein